MKVLVTGAAGQVGCRLVRQILDQNWEARGTVLPDDPAIERLDGIDVELLAGDLQDDEFVQKAVDGVDAVAHTANLVGPHFDNNIQTNRVVTRVCAQNADRLERYVYVSSSGVFPNDSHNLACAYHPVDELHPKRAPGEYNLSKLIGEFMAEDAGRSMGLRWSIVRPSHALSGDSVLSNLSVGRAVGLLKNGQRHPLSEIHTPVDTEPWRELEEKAESMSQPCAATDLDGRPWMYQPNDARDVALAIVCAVRSEAAVHESFNLGAPAPFSFVEAAEIMREWTGQEPAEARLPVRWVYDHCVNKAKSLIGFQPRGSLRAMIQSSLLVRKGEIEGYTWDGVDEAG